MAGLRIVTVSRIAEDRSLRSAAGSAGERVRPSELIRAKIRTRNATRKVGFIDGRSSERTLSPK